MEESLEDVSQATITEAGTALRLSGFLSQYVILKKNKKPGHNDLLSVTICPHYVPVLESAPGFLV